MEVFVKILQVIFIAGCCGCAITIPICAWKYFSVLFEKDTEEEMRDGRPAPSETTL